MSIDGLTSTISPAFQPVAAGYLKTVTYLAANDPVAANTHQLACFERFLAIIAEPEAVWALPAMRTLVSTVLRVVTYAEAASAGRPDSLEGEGLVSRDFFCVSEFSFRQFSACFIIVIV